MGEIVEELNPLIGGNDGHEFENISKAEIVLKTIGPARPSRLLVPSSIKVRDLRGLVASNGRLPIDNVSLILRGNVLCDMKNGEDVYIQLNDGDSLIVAVKPKPPVRDGYDDDDDDDLKFKLPRSSSWWKKRLYSFLHDNLKLPDIILMFIFSLSLKAWAFTIMWFILAPIAHKWDLGPLYVSLLPIIASIFETFSDLLQNVLYDLSRHAFVLTDVCLPVIFPACFIILIIFWPGFVLFKTDNESDLHAFILFLLHFIICHNFSTDNCYGLFSNSL
ncbi:uncharacterized protein LOC114738583 isoform X1 [Neltuma alba]|uniref:uncharacterized protein LOC114738583 isoform X1 n=1 Tax=Neltuma alba TaxID=207710 RepID=UPI0010A4D87C|nr:uncharacterized protein LOC114738583 isoform X1 [Prosopis alba]